MKRYNTIWAALLLPMFGHAQNMAMCTYDASGNRLSRFTYTDRSRNSQKMAEKDGNVDMSNDRLGNHTIHIIYHSIKSTLTIEILGLDDSDKCSANLYKLTGQLVMNQDITTSPTEIELYDVSNGVYILRLILNGENRCWKIVKE